ncbi:MAG TPA: c-type cytochrome [Thermoanaerobaculia bacterium]|jgi:mono/diheme cytochrome c family protein
MGKGFILGIVAAVAALVAAGYLFVVSGALPSGQDSKPGRLEKWAANASLRATMRREAQGLKSPIEPSEDNLVAGVALYRAHCQVCHGGADGAMSSIAKGLSPKAPQLAKDGVEDDPEGVTYWKIAHGIRFTGMPAFRETLSEREMWQLSLFASRLNSLPPRARSTWLGEKPAP